MYMYLALGLANVFGLQAKILGEDDAVRALVFHTPSCEYIREHKGKVLGFGVKISKIKMTPAAQDKIIIDPLDIIVWLFDHAEAKHLDVSECCATAHTIAKIAKLERLEVLDLSDCELSENSLVPIGSSPTSRGVLRKLYTNYNKLSLKDALAFLAVLKVL